jgi:hypothetical protein
MMSRLSFIQPWIAEKQRNALPLIIMFAPLTALVLFFDSQILRTHQSNLFANGHSLGQLYSNGMAVLYFLLLLPALQRTQRVMALVFLPIAVVGEYLFSLVFHLYTYAEHSVTIYVPLGHAIMFGTGLLLCDTAWVV